MHIVSLLISMSDKKLTIFLVGVLLLIVLGFGFAFSSTGSLEGRFGAFTSTSAARTIYVDPVGGGTGLTSSSPVDFTTAIGMASGGDTLMVLPGTYQPTSTIKIDKIIRIVGSSSSTPVIDCSLTIGGAIDDDICFKYEPIYARGIGSMSGLKFINTRYGIWVSNNNSPTLRNIEFDYPRHDAWEHAAIYVDGVNSMPVISDVVIDDSGLSGSSYYDEILGIKVVDGTPTISNAEINNMTYGIYIEGTNISSEISNSFFTDNFWGIIGIGPFDGLDIHHNHFVGPTTSISGTSGGVTVGSGQYAFVHDNSFEGMAFGVALNDISYDSYVEVYKNSFELQVFSIDTRNYSVTYASKNAIYENNITGSTYGVKSSGAQEFSSVYDNHIFATGTAIDAAFAAATVFTNNLIEGSKDDGYLGSGSNATFAYNTLVDGKGDGIDLMSSDASYVVNNIVYRHAKKGVSVDTLSSTSAQLGYNDSYGNATDYSGSYVDLGGNLSVDPVFVRIGDYALQASSPLLNYADLYFVVEDYFGNLRDAKTATVGPEIGAFES